MRQLGVNSLWLALARLGAQGLSVVFSVLLARRLGEAGFGHYAWLAALVAIGNAATTFGTDTLIIRELARDEKTTPVLLGAALWLQLLLAALWLMVAGWLAGLGLLFIFSLALIPLALYTPFSAALRAHERMDQFLWLNLAVAALQVAAVVVFVQTVDDLPALAWALIGVQTVGALLAALLCLRTVPRFAVAWQWDGEIVLTVLRAAFPLALLTALALIYQRLGVLALTALTDESTTGWYSVAARVVEGLKLGHYALTGALLPRLARSPNFTDTRRVWVGLLAVSALMALAVTLLAQPLITLLFGARYQPAAEVLPVLGWTLVPYSLSAYLSVQLVARNVEYWVLLGTALTLIASLALHNWLIPAFGLLGAGWAMVVSECVLALLLWGWSRPRRFQEPLRS
jgi:O-antigen/teichoic acid export membrane protein